MSYDLSQNDVHVIFDALELQAQTYEWENNFTKATECRQLAQRIVFNEDRETHFGDV